MVFVSSSRRFSNSTHIQVFPLYFEVAHYPYSNIDEKGRSTQLAELPRSDRRPLMQRFFTVVISYNENVAVRRNDPKDVKNHPARAGGGDYACLTCALVGGEVLEPRLSIRG